MNEGGSFRGSSRPIPTYVSHARFPLCSTSFIAYRVKIHATGMFLTRSHSRHLKSYLTRLFCEHRVWLSARLAMELLSVLG